MAALDVKSVGKEDGETIPVRRNTGGNTTVTVSFSLPIPLDIKLRQLAESERKSRSLVVTELIEKGLK